MNKRYMLSFHYYKDEIKTTGCWIFKKTTKKKIWKSKVLIIEVKPEQEQMLINSFKSPIIRDFLIIAFGQITHLQLEEITSQTNFITEKE